VVWQFDAAEPAEHLLADRRVALGSGRSAPSFHSPRFDQISRGNGRTAGFDSQPSGGKRRGLATSRLCHDSGLDHLRYSGDFVRPIAAANSPRSRLGHA